MPTALRIGGHRFFFYAGDGGEPRHIHVERDDKVAKFWLDPVRLQRSGGFNSTKIKTIHKIIGENRLKLLEAWNEYFHC
ncbi:MAG: DUF4160 domain-containing protein [Nitrospinae bacterium]|nr:DUF4160 domain-containing protein [Nitrospinota bacterium]